MQRGFIKRLGGQAIDVQLVGSATTLTNVPFSGQIDTSTLAVGVPVLVDIVNNQHVVLHTLIEAARNPVQPGQSTTSSVLNNALLADGTVPLTGNLPVAPGVTVDGYDISVLGQAISNLQAADTIARTGWTAFTHSTHLVSTISADATEILVRDAIFELNEQAVVSNTNGEIEFMQVTSAPTQALDDSGRICYRYTVTRRVGTSPGGLSTGWAAATLVNGLTKRGYITVDNRHVNSNNAPNITGAIWTDDPPTTTERVFRLGDLRGILGITSNSFGFAVGALDTQNSYMLFNGADNSFLLRNAGIEILDDLGEQVVKIYGINEGGRLAGDYDFGKLVKNRFVGETATWGIYRNDNPIIEINDHHSFLRDLFTIGNPTGARIDLGDIDSKATFVLRDRHGVAKLVARTDDSNDVFFYVGNPPPQNNSMWFDSADGVLNVNGVFAGSIYSNAGEIGGWNISATRIVSPNGYMALDPVEGLVLQVVDEVASGLEGSSPEGSNDPDYFRAISFVEDGVTLPLHRIYAARQQASGAEVNSLFIASQPVGDANSRAATWVSAISDMEAKTVIRAIGGYDTDDQAVTQIFLYAYRAEHSGVFDYRRIDIESDGLHIKSTPITSFTGTVPAGTIVHSDGTFDPGGLGSGIYTYIAGDWKMLVSNTPDLETKSADFTAAGAKVYLCNTGSNNITVSLPDASKLPDGWTYTIKKINASNTVTIDPYSTQQIDGSAASRTLTANWSYLTISSRPIGAWYIIGSG